MSILRARQDAVHEQINRCLIRTWLLTFNCVCHHKFYALISFYITFYFVFCMVECARRSRSFQLRSKLSPKKHGVCVCVQCISIRPLESSLSTIVYRIQFLKPLHVHEEDAGQGNLLNIDLGRNVYLYHLPLHRTNTNGIQSIIILQKFSSYITVVVRLCTTAVWIRKASQSPHVTCDQRGKANTWVGGGGGDDHRWMPFVN